MSRKNKDGYNAYMRDYMGARYRAYKEKIIRQLGGLCQRCGSDQSLEVHHVDPTQKELSISKEWSRKPAVLATELAKCILLCNDCHKAQHAAAHGGDRRYRVHGCRCDACVAGHAKRLIFQRERMRKMRANKKLALRM